VSHDHKSRYQLFVWRKKLSVDFDEFWRKFNNDNAKMDEALRRNYKKGVYMIGA